MDEINRIVAFAVKKDVELYTDMPSGWKKDRRCADCPVRKRLDLQRGIPLFREEKEGIVDQEKLHGMNIR